MTTRKRTKLVHEGRYVAEVQVDIEYDETGGSPYLSADNAYKVDDVREALRRGGLASSDRRLSSCLWTWRERFYDGPDLLPNKRGRLVSVWMHTSSSGETHSSANN